jgi:hypothetical protein
MFLLSAPAMMCTVRPAAGYFRPATWPFRWPLLARWFARYAARNLRPRHRRRRRSSSNALFGMLPRNNWKIMHFQEEPRSQHTIVAMLFLPPIHDSAADLHSPEFWTPSRRRQPFWMQPAQFYVCASFRAFFLKTFEVWYTCFL